jgi:hypothetical protein
MDIAKNTDSASWITARLHPFARDVGSIIPEGFTAYARVFHPPLRRTSGGAMIPVRWKDIAAANNRTIEAEVQRFCRNGRDPSQLSATGEELWNQQSGTGNLPREIAVRLARILSAHTRNPELCWYGVWEGYPDVRIRWDHAPMFSVPERNLFLLCGTVADALTTLSVTDWSYRSPNLWWPDDRAWCVATEIDFQWSYVGGSTACIEQVLSDPELEALPTNSESGNCMEK